MKKSANTVRKVPSTAPSAAPLPNKMKKGGKVKKSKTSTNQAAVPAVKPSYKSGGSMGKCRGGC